MMNQTDGLEQLTKQELGDLKEFYREQIYAMQVHNKSHGWDYLMVKYVDASTMYHQKQTFEKKDKLYSKKGRE